MNHSFIVCFERLPFHSYCDMRLLNEYISLAQIVDQFPCEIKLVIFDDGLQDKDLDYDLKAVCFDSEKWIGNGHLLPSGPLREKLDSLKKYNIVFLKQNYSKLDEIINLIKYYNPSITIFITEYKFKNLNKFNISDNYLIFSGIGNHDIFKNGRRSVLPRLARKRRARA